MRGALLEPIHAELRRALAEQPELRLFTILDGARDPRIARLLGEHDYVKSACLYAGALSERFKAAAPWLVALETGESALLEALLADGWGGAWGSTC